MKKLIVFDFDGVIADSEILANAVLADIVTELGAPLTPEASLDMFMGKRLGDVIAVISALTGRSVVECTAADIDRRTLARFRTELREIAGVRAYLDTFGSLKRCIASSSSAERLAGCLDILGLSEAFDPHVYSASLVERGKPHPDIYLHAARECDIEPADALVIEDSVNGIRAAVAAGMTAIGLLAASHIRNGHAERLRDAGAHHIARNYEEVAEITHRLIV